MKCYYLDRPMFTEYYGGELIPKDQQTIISYVFCFDVGYYYVTNENVFTYVGTDFTKSKLHTPGLTVSIPEKKILDLLNLEIERKLVGIRATISFKKKSIKDLEESLRKEEHYLNTMESILRSK